MVLITTTYYLAAYDVMVRKYHMIVVHVALGHIELNRRRPFEGSIVNLDKTQFIHNK